LLYLRTLREYFEYTRKPFHAILQTAIYRLKFIDKLIKYKINHLETAKHIFAYS
jgi:hypothetical protein